MTLDQLVIFLVVIAIVIGITTVNTWDALRTWRRLRRRGINGGYILLAWTHVWGSGARATQSTLILIAGICLYFNLPQLTFLPILVSTILLGYNSIRARIDRDRAADVEIERQEREEVANALATPPPVAERS